MASKLLHKGPTEHFFHCFNFEQLTIISFFFLIEWTQAEKMGFYLLPLDVLYHTQKSGITMIKDQSIDVMRLKRFEYEWKKK